LSAAFLPAVAMQFIKAVFLPASLKAAGAAM
jgi:hypothetical protein